MKNFSVLIGLALLSLPASALAADPIVRIPEWGAMTTPTQWNRAYADYTRRELVRPPAYNMEKLVVPMAKLLKHRNKNVRDITRKLFYSTRYCGKYDLDAGEFTGKHCALDLKAPLGTPVHAVQGGRVVEVTTDKVFGLHIRIVSDDHAVWLYAHLGEASVSVDDVVDAGKILGTVGMTGRTSSPHLHLQLNAEDGSPKNPVPFLRYKG